MNRWPKQEWRQEWPCICNRGDRVLHQHYEDWLTDDGLHKCARCRECSGYRPDIPEHVAIRILLGPVMSDEEAARILLGPREPDVVPFRDYYEAYVLGSRWPKGKSFATFAREIWDYLQASAASASAAAHTPAESMTLILAQLTPADFARFHAAHITYSGSTGPRDTGDAMGPYIATFAFNFVAALTALDWTHPDVRLEGQSLIVTRASIAPTWFCQQCCETFTDTRRAAAHSRETYHVITSDPNRPSTPGGLDARSEDA